MNSSELECHLSKTTSYMLWSEWMNELRTWINELNYLYNYIKFKHLNEINEINQLNEWMNKMISMN